MFLRPTIKVIPPPQKCEKILIFFFKNLFFNIRKDTFLEFKSEILFHSQSGVSGLNRCFVKLTQGRRKYKKYYSIVFLHILVFYQTIGLLILSFSFNSNLLSFISSPTDFWASN